MIPSPQHWFEAVAETLGEAYLKYSFTRGTAQEVDFLVEALGIDASHRVLDVGCGPGRHCLELASRGVRVHGVDISARFIELARAAAEAAGLAELATFEVADARTWRGEPPFDRVISLCQGAFGLAGGPGSDASLDPDVELFANLACSLAPGGRLAVSAFSAYFQVRMLDAATDCFDAERGVNHETTVIKDESGADHAAELWTTCLTPRELRLIARGAGLVADAVHSVRPGAYGAHRPTIESVEFLLLATRAD